MATAMIALRNLLSSPFTDDHAYSPRGIQHGTREEPECAAIRERKNNSPNAGTACSTGCGLQNGPLLWSTVPVL